MSPAVHRLLWNVTKWVFIPLALFLVGFFFLGPYVLSEVSIWFLQQKTSQSAPPPANDDHPAPQ
ncbi:MAG: hypothetical protein K6T17_06290 [Fimbriimonadales bacterium]|nr:hypothetical protein [Fimbriimonadales bacterium]